MGNKFYVPGAERAAKVDDLFAVVAPRYDLINDLQSLGLHRFWKRRFVQIAQPRSGDRILDLCCGTGDIAFALADSGAKVLGLDFSAAMLRVAQRRAITQPGVCWIRGDALRLPFGEGEFDILTIGYGLRNLAYFPAAILEMLRVLRPRGRLLVLDFGKPDNPIWRRIYFAYLEWLVPVFGRLFCGDAATHSYIRESLKHYPTQRGVAALMAEMNCERVHTVNLLGGIMSINYGEKGLCG
jgi:demethylmenaquinone methyltransferase / 2-methoxy-6-polyprenyl-1,4-benzoquinol methylase